MHDDHQHVLGRREPQQDNPPGQVGAQVKAALGLLRKQASQVSSGHLADDQGGPGWAVEDVLPGGAAGVGEDGAQALVPGGHIAERRL